MQFVFKGTPRYAKQSKILRRCISPHPPTLTVTLDHTTPRFTAMAHFPFHALLPNLTTLQFDHAKGIINIALIYIFMLSLRVGIIQHLPAVCCAILVTFLS